MSGPEQLCIGLVIGAVLGLLAGAVRNMLHRDGPTPEECEEILRLLREVAPQLRSLGDVFTGWPDAFGVLDEIVGQLTSNGGKTMADAVTRLDKAAIVSARAAVESAAAAVESAKAAERLAGALGLVDAKLTLGVGSSLRTESGMRDAATLAIGVANDLATAQIAIEGVASDLHESHRHARSVATDAPPGAAADAASTGISPENVSHTDSIGDAPDEYA